MLLKIITKTNNFSLSSNINRAIIKIKDKDKGKFKDRGKDMDMDIKTLS